MKIRSNGLMIVMFVATVTNSCFTEAQVMPPVPMALLPTRYKCLDLLEFEKLKIDQQTGDITYDMDQLGIHLVSDYNAVLGWLRGFFTAWNFWRPDANGNLTRHTKSHQWMTWIFSYCRAHPSATLPQAATELGNALINDAPKN